MMQTLCYLAFTFMCSFLSPVLSVQCNETQYAWPVDLPQLCCNKCPPGEHMVRRSDNSCKIECEPCTAKRYTDNYNVEMNCILCEYCNKPNMEYKSHCIATHNSVCRCKAGYSCKDQPCTECVQEPEPAPPTTKPTLPPPTTALFSLTTKSAPPELIRDNVWFLVIIVLLCTVVTSLIITKTFLHWIRSKHGYLLAEKPVPVPICAKDEQVSTPVQEVCGKCDHLLDI